jgi:hypothetical protein
MVSASTQRCCWLQDLKTQGFRLTLKPTYHYLSLFIIIYLFIYLFFHMFFKSINSKSDQPTVPYISHCFLRFQAGSRTSQSQPWQLLGGGLVAAMPQKSPKPPAARRVCRLNTVHRGSSCVETWNPKNKIE